MFERESPDGLLKELAAQLRTGSELVLASRFGFFLQIERDEQLHAGLLGTIWIGMYGVPFAADLEDKGEDAHGWSLADTRMYIGVVNPITQGEDTLRETLLMMQRKDWTREQVAGWLESTPKSWTGRAPDKKRSFR